MLSRLALGILVPGVLLWPVQTLPGPHDDARFVLHAADTQPVDPVTVCTLSPNAEGLSCLDYNVASPILEGTYVYVVVVNAAEVGVLGMSLGVQYSGTAQQGIDPQWVRWFRCADGLEFPGGSLGSEWPRSGGGSRITWTTCQTGTFADQGVHAVAGAFYVYAYSEDVLRIITNNNNASGPELRITACDGAGTSDLLDVFGPSGLPDHLGRVHFGGDGNEGYNPCTESALSGGRLPQAVSGPQDGAQIALHSIAATTAAKVLPICEDTPGDQGQSCLEYNLVRPAGPAILYLGVAGAGEVGVSAVDCGIDYTGSSGQGIDPTFVTWTGCADGQEFPNGPPLGDEWPAPGGSMRLIWTTCQTETFGNQGVHAIMGAFYVYAYGEGTFEVTPDWNIDPHGADLNVLACGGGTTNLYSLLYPDHETRLARVHFGGDGSLARNPCLDFVSVQPTTWGKLKNHYR